MTRRRNLKYGEKLPSDVRSRNDVRDQCRGVRCLRERTKRESLAGIWGDALFSVGTKLSSCGALIASVDLSEIPEKTAMLEAQRELLMLNEQIAECRKQLQLAGMDTLL